MNSRFSEYEQQSKRSKAGLFLYVYSEIERQNCIPDHDLFVDYFVWKANNDPKYADLYVTSGTSDKNSNHKFLQISKQSWVIKNTGICDEMSLHLEGDNKRLSLHFEVTPYTPLAKLAHETRRKYEEQRDLLRKTLENVAVTGVKVCAPDKRETITLIKFIISDTDDLKNTFQKLSDIINAVEKSLDCFFIK